MRAWTTAFAIVALLVTGLPATQDLDTFLVGYSSGATLVYAALAIVFAYVASAEYAKRWFYRRVSL